jgi:putative flavoprotein involved in K+ transport
VLERAEVANSWLRERWESLRLLTPNWLSRLPGAPYRGADPDGFMTMPQVVELITNFAAATSAPVRTHMPSLRCGGEMTVIDLPRLTARSAAVP